MRQGPEYSMRTEEDDLGRQVVYVPLELIEDFAGANCVRWTDNQDGTFTLKIFDYA